MNVTIIVLTGGPCGGKTAALPILKQRLLDRGIHAITVPEEFTAMMEKGLLRPSAEFGEDYTVHFQSELARHMISQQEALVKLSGYHKNRQTVILLDRGVVDNLAFVPKSLRHKVTVYGHQLETIAACMYDRVIHMQSVAVDKPHLYHNDNNEHRLETAEESALLDSQTKELWRYQPNYYVLDNDCSFDKKVEKALSLITDAVACPDPNHYEREQKFLLEFNPDIKERCVVIIDKYTNISADTYLRVRKIVDISSDTIINYEATYKRGGSSLIRKEKTIAIESDEFSNPELLEKKKIKKLRNCITLDIGDRRYTGEVENDLSGEYSSNIMEVELRSTDEPLTLDQVNKALEKYAVVAVEDVTTDSRFYNNPSIRGDND